MTADDLRDLRSALRAELAPIKQMIDSTYSDFARLVAADVARVQTENTELKTKLAAMAKIISGPSSAA